MPDDAPKPFGPPEVTSAESLTDDRNRGDYASVYPWTAWIQIIFELLYLLSMLLGALFGLALLASALLLGPPRDFLPWLTGGPPPNSEMSLWLATGLAGVCGGCAFSLKWLYHGVAKQRWHRDRFIWRLIVPILSAVLAVFTGMMILSGLLPTLKATSLASPAAGAGLGFFVGLFSDNLLASLQRVAKRLFGTVDRSGRRDGTASE